MPDEDVVQAALRDYYEAAVRERMGLLRQEHPDGDYPDAFAEHQTGECIECDALSRLENE